MVANNHGLLFMVGVGNPSWDTLLQLDVILASIKELSAASRERLHGP